MADDLFPTKLAEHLGQFGGILAKAHAITSAWAERTSTFRASAPQEWEEPTRQLAAALAELADTVRSMERQHANLCRIGEDLAFRAVVLEELRRINPRRAQAVVRRLQGWNARLNQRAAEAVK